MKIPSFREAPSTLKPTAFGSLLAGRVTVPNSPLVESSFRVAPLPMKSVAPEMEMPSNSPWSRATVPATSGSSMPETRVRLTSTVARAYTTSAMANPTVPPMRKVGSVASSCTWAAPREDCFQFRTAPLDTEVRFNWNTNPVPMSFTASTPCNWALPKAPCRPVYLRLEVSGAYAAPDRRPVAVKMPRWRVPPLTPNPTAFGSLPDGRLTVPKAALVESWLRVAPLPMNKTAWVTAMLSRSPW